MLLPLIIVDCMKHHSSPLPHSTPSLSSLSPLSHPPHSPLHPANPHTPTRPTRPPLPPQRIKEHDVKKHLRADCSRNSRALHEIDVIHRADEAECREICDNILSHDSGCHVTSKYAVLCYVVDKLPPTTQERRYEVWLLKMFYKVGVGFGQNQYLLRGICEKLPYQDYPPLILFAFPTFKFCPQTDFFVLNYLIILFINYISVHVF